jgi:hypothetical protein
MPQHYVSRYQLELNTKNTEYPTFRNILFVDINCNLTSSNNNLFHNFYFNAP